MTLAMKRALNLQIGRQQPAAVDEQIGLEIAVVFTSVDATAAALARASALAKSLGGRITLVVPQIVPYPLPLAAPPVLLDFQEKRFRDLAAQSSAQIQVELYLCRDDAETLRNALKPHSLVVLGCRHRWWPTREKRLARMLQRMGHQVIVAEPTVTN